MITVDAGQLTRLQENSETRFIAAEAEQLALYAPPLAASAGRPGLEAAVRLGLQAARRAGFTAAPQIRLYLQLMTSFGSRFGKDLQYQWLHPLLDSDKGLPARERARLLHWHSTLYLDRTYGKNGLHGIAAGLQASRLDMAALAEVGSDFANRAPHLLARLHPQRVPYLSGSIGRWLIEQAAEGAARHGLGGAAAAPLLVCLMFGFGHGVVDDPLHPWVREALSNSALSGLNKTAELLARTQRTLSSLLQPTMEGRR